MMAAVDSQVDGGSGQVEWLNLGPPEHRPARARPRRRRRSGWVLAAAVTAAVVLIAASVNSTAKRKATPHHRSKPAATSQAARPNPTRPSSPAAILVADAGRRLLDVPADWELFGRGSDVVVRIELARGRVTRTTAPALSGGGGISFLAGPDRVIVAPYDSVPGYAVPDGGPARRLAGALGGGGSVLPGPDARHLWVQVSNGESSTVVLVGYDGRPTSVSLSATGGNSVVSDGAGYLAFFATGGVYDLRPDGIRRITTGELLAAGPTRWLTRECDERYRCALVVIDQQGGARRALNLPPGTFNSDGLIAPDGSTAALLDRADSGRPTLHLIDLSSGADRATDVFVDTELGYGGGTFVWAPDSRSLFVVDRPGRVHVLDRRTLRVAALDVSLPPVSQLALRSGSR